MNIKIVLNLALTSAFALLISCSEPASAPKAADAETTAPAEAAPADQTAQIMAFLEQTYSYFEQDGASPPDRNGVFDTSLLAMMTADEEATPEDEIGTLDSDPLCGCQDYSIGKPNIQISDVTATSAKAKVKLVDSEVSLELVKQGDDWRIHDVFAYDSSLRKLFTDAAAARTK